MRGECGGEGKLVSRTVVTANANSLGFPSREREPGEQERSKETEGEKKRRET